jgi:hypothetical protein
MFTILAEIDTLEQNGMWNFFNPIGAFCLLGIIYLLFCISLVIKTPNKSFSDEATGLVKVIVMLVGFSLFFFFFRGLFGGDRRLVTMINGKEITKQEIVYVYEYLMDRRPDIGGVEKWKQGIIFDSLEKKYDRAEEKWVPNYDDRWGVSASTIGSRQPDDYEYYYSYVGRKSGWLPMWIYHPAMWVVCPLISMCCFLGCFGGFFL